MTLDYSQLRQEFIQKQKEIQRKQLAKTMAKALARK